MGRIRKCTYSETWGLQSNNNNNNNKPGPSLMMTIRLT